ncbi:MAG: hypothetical protein ACQER9_04970 [Nanobdellota archaeon]
MKKLDEMRVRYIPSAVYCYGSDVEVVEYGFKKDFKFRSVNDIELEKCFCRVFK